MLEQGELLTLDDNKKYAVVYTCKLDNRDYAFLIDQDDYNNTMLCEYVDNQLREVLDEKIIGKFLSNFKNTTN